jgi:hypothetical protein
MKNLLDNLKENNQDFVSYLYNYYYKQLTN